MVPSGSLHRRVIMVVVGALVAVGLVGTPVAASEGLVIEGSGDTFADVTLAREVVVDDLVFLGSGEDPTALGASRDGDYVGLVVYRRADWTPVFGALQIEAFDEDFGAPATFSLAAEPDYVLPPGDYRLVLLSSGPGQVRLATSGGQGLHVETTHAHPSAGGEIGEVTSTATEPAEGPPVDYVYEEDATLLTARQRIKPTGVGGFGSCEHRRDDDPCTPRPNNFGFSGGGTGGSTTFDGLSAQRPGVWQARFASMGDQTLRYTVISAAPGPRDEFRLPDAEANELARTDSPTTGSRTRDIADACPDDVVPADRFRDVDPDDAYASAIDCASWHQLLRGVDAERYQPGSPLTRAQLASVLDRLIQRSTYLPQPGTERAFPDTRGSVHETSIQRLAAYGVVAGRPDGRFQPNQPVTRAQAATFIHRAIAVMKGIPLNNSTNYFIDDEGSVHEANIDALARNGIVNGTSEITFSPNDPITRAQTATILTNSLDLLIELGRIELPE